MANLNFYIIELSGFDCRYNPNHDPSCSDVVARGDSGEELRNTVAQHGTSAHGFTEITGENAAKVRAVIRVDSRSGLRRVAGTDDRAGPAAAAVVLNTSSY
ncbi:MAG: DUF1059 domain-containing protein [SAR324 cluster bacterium]|nr:DUF1059 domain-containing protein [SAR324 cluster bacterium]